MATCDDATSCLRGTNSAGNCEAVRESTLCAAQPRYSVAMSKAPVISAVVAVAVTAAAFALNPSPEQHRDKIRAAVAERSPLAGALGVGALTAFASTYHPLGVASYTTVNGQVVSIGAFGVVVVLQRQH